MKKLLFISLAAILALSIGLIGCTGEGPGGGGECNVTRSVLLNPQGYPGAVCPEYGGTLIILQSGTGITNIGAPWLLGGGRDSPMARPAVEKLLGLDTSFDLVPQLAVNWTEDAGNKQITFWLRQGVTFHDGTAFNATAAAWCMNIYRNATGQNPELDNCNNVEILGPYKVRLNFTVWDPNLLRCFAATQAGVMVSPTYAKSVGTNSSTIKTHPMGTGPFKWKSYTPASKLEYEKYNNYWQAGLPYLDGIEIDFVPTEASRLATFLAKNGDVMHEMSTSNAIWLKSLGYEVVQRLVHIKGMIGDNVDPSSPFYGENGTKVMKAIAHALDLDTIIPAVFDHQYTATNQLAMPPGTQGVSMWTAWNSSITGYAYCVTQARQLMVEAGYNATNHLATTLTYGDHNFDDYWISVQSYLAQAYIDLTLSYTSNYYGFRKGGGWTNNLLEYQFSYNGFELTYDLSLKMNCSPDEANYSKWSTANATDFNNLYYVMLNETDLGVREQQYKTLNGLAIDTYCLALPQVGFEVFDARQPWVHDLGYSEVATEYCPEIVFMTAH